ncbi:hypothetical protein ElyMa_000155700 [Elysia marginata]|uniref:Uncharacterized protein n=1 Tax=Elysia marginata TaxID=1093978 RepID=A0AAV4ER35_9GAST|nr:hypothetical protein ElyMa_000155700 [Elysia marginata]
MVVQRRLATFLKTLYTSTLNTLKTDESQCRFKFNSPGLLSRRLGNIEMYRWSPLHELDVHDVRLPQNRADRHAASNLLPAEESLHTI